MFTELIITIWLFATGFIFCNHVFKSRDILNKLIFAFPISSTYTVIFFQLLSICSIKISYIVIIISEVVKLLSLLKFRDPHFIDNLKYIVPYTVIIIFPFFLIPWMTHDSSMFALYAESIKNSNVLDFPQSGIVSYGFFLSGLHAFYNLFTGSPFTVSIPFCFGLSLAIFLIKYFLEIFDNGKKVNYKIILLVIILLTTPMFILGFIYIHNNLISSFFIFSIFFILARQFPLKLITSQIFIFFLITGFLITRMENGIIFSILMIFLFLFSKEFLKYKFGIYLGILYGYVWYGLIYIKSLEYSDVILSQKTSLIILSSLIIINFFIIFYDFILRKLKFINLQLIFFILLFMIFIPFLIKPVEAIESLKSLFINAGISGKWSFFWYIFLIFVLGIDKQIFYTNLKSNKFNYRLLYLVVSLLIFILIYIMSFFRVPYRLGYGDSGNRLLITIYPFAYIYMVNCIYKIKNIKNSFFFTK